MKPGRTVEMTGTWKTRKTKTRFPFVSHSPWKSLRDFHIPTAPAVFVSQNSQNQNSRKETLPADRFAPAFRSICAQAATCCIIKVCGPRKSPPGCVCLTTHILRLNEG